MGRKLRKLKLARGPSSSACSAPGGTAMRLMVLGATGFIGPAVVERLAALGHEPLGVSRSPPKTAFAGRHLAADRSDPAAVARLAQAERIEAVIDLLAMTEAATAPLLAALAGVTGRYVLASSGDVYRQYGALQRKEPGDQPLARIGEDAPLRASRFPYRADPRRPPQDPRAWMDDYDNIPIDQAALAQPGLEAAVVRLPMIFGPRDRQRRFAWAIGPMRAGRLVLEIDAAWAGWRTSYGFVDDVAEGLALAATHPAAAGRTYNVGPEEEADHAAWAARFAEALGWRGEIRAVARQALPNTTQAALDALDLSYPLVTDTRRIRDELGYAEVTSLDESLRRTIEDEAARRGA
jgi:nucleoside-diphosphate-sugar epimerase